MDTFRHTLLDLQVQHHARPSVDGNLELRPEGLRFSLNVRKVFQSSELGGARPPGRHALVEHESWTRSNVA